LNEYFTVTDFTSSCILYDCIHHTGNIIIKNHEFDFQLRQQIHAIFSGSPLQENAFLPAPAANFTHGHSEVAVRLKGFLDLRGSKGKGVGIAAGGRPVDVAGIAEQVGGTPQQFYAGFPLALCLGGCMLVWCRSALAWYVRSCK